MSKNTFGEIEYPGWEIVRKIGDGSFGKVYEIKRKVNGFTERAALKVISIPGNESEIEELRLKGLTKRQITIHYRDYKDKVIDEYETMQRLQNCKYTVNSRRCIANIHSDGIGWDVLIEMELLTPLLVRLKSEFTEEDVLDLGTDLCSALSACQREGIIHRDIKPQNIFVSENGIYKLGDFGIAKELNGTTQTATRRIGSMNYMAPEIYWNDRYSNKADIYSLGIVMYMLLNKRRLPFEPLPPEELKKNDIEESRSKRLNGKQIPEPYNGSETLKRVVLKACAFDPGDRYQTAEEMLRDLDVIGESTETAFPQNPVTEKEEPNKLKVWPFILAGIFTLFPMIAFWYNRDWYLLVFVIFVVLLPPGVRIIVQYFRKPDKIYKMILDYLIVVFGQMISTLIIIFFAVGVDIKSFYVFSLLLFVVILLPLFKYLKKGSK